MFNFEAFDNFDFDDFKPDFEEKRKNDFLQKKIDILINVVRTHRDKELEKLMFDGVDTFDLNEAFEILEKYEKLERRITKTIKENVSVRIG